MDSYRPRDTLEYSLRWWWLIVVCMFLGTAAAWGISRLHAPIYEARAEITINIDLTRTGVLSQEETDMAINAAGALIDSTDLRRQLLADAEAKGIVFTGADDQKVVFMERKAESYALRVQLRDPQQAAWMVNHWAELAILDLQAAEQHALAAETLQRSIESLAACIQQASSDSNTPGCNPADLTVIQTALKETGAALTAERAAAHAIFPGLRASLTRTAEVPTAPVAFYRKWMLLAGALLGLLIAVSALALRLPDKFSRSRKRA